MKILTPNSFQNSRRNSFSSLRIDKRGKMTISKAAALRLNLAPGDQVIIAQDENNKKQFFIAKTTSDGFVIRTNKQGAFYFNSAGFSILLFDLFDNPDITSILFKMPKATKEFNGKTFFNLFPVDPKSIMAKK